MRGGHVWASHDQPKRQTEAISTGIKRLRKDPFSWWTSCRRCIRPIPSILSTLYSTATCSRSQPPGRRCSLLNKQSFYDSLTLSVRSSSDDHLRPNSLTSSLLSWTGTMSISDRPHPSSIPHHHYPASLPIPLTRSTWKYVPDCWAGKAGSVPNYERQEAEWRAGRTRTTTHAEISQVDE